MNEIMVFCTGAQNNGEHYVENINKWKTELLTLFNNVDLKVFVDGNLPEIDNVEVINNNPILGRITPDGGNFPGWKRSFVTALKYFINSNYKYLVHIENDVKINTNKLNNVETLQKYFQTDGLYISFSHEYHFLESAFMILNDKQFVQELINFYSIQQNINENACFEISKLRQGKCNVVFESIRIEDNLQRINKILQNPTKYTFYTQYNWNKPLI